MFIFQSAERFWEVLTGAGGAAAGWLWENIAAGIFRWLADGVVVFLEWVWGMLDSAATPRVTDDWFRNELAGQILVLALAVTVAMMLASAIQSALGGRPEQIVDALKEGPKAVVASVFTITVIDLLLRVVDETSEMIWEVGRDDMASMVEGMLVIVTLSNVIGPTFLGPLLMLFGLVALLGLAVSLTMRAALIYVTAALAPLVWASSVLPVLRGSSRRLVHLLIALILSKLAIVVTLVIAVKLVANLGDLDEEVIEEDAGAVIGALLTGFTCFLVASVSPWVLYKLMPTVEGAAGSTGIAGGWGRSLMALGQTAMMTSGLGASAATRSVGGQQGVEGVQGTLTATGGWPTGDAASSQEAAPSSGRETTGAGSSPTGQDDSADSSHPGATDGSPTSGADHDEADGSSDTSGGSGPGSESGTTSRARNAAAMRVPAGAGAGASAGGPEDEDQDGDEDRP